VDTRPTDLLLQPSQLSNEIVVCSGGGTHALECLFTGVFATYAKNAIPLFKPKEDFASQWAQMAKKAGCRYLVFTTKHHDGFALHDSKVSDFDAGSVLNRDLVKEIVDACRKEGLRVGFYHSVIDWHHDQYAYLLSKELPYPLKGQPYPNGHRDHNKYIQFLHAQASELMSNYGQVDVIWWDYSSTDFQGERAWKAFELMDRVKEKQPQVIMNNRLFRIPEAHIPATGLPDLDWETCMTMNTTWGFSEHDHAWKSDEVLIRNLIDIASKGGNYLLNIGPTGDGSIPTESTKSLKVIGEWMDVNGEAIYGTKASPFEKLSWGRCSQKSLPGGKTRLYLHIFDWPADGKLVVPLGTDATATARRHADHKDLHITPGTTQTTILVGEPMLHNIATVVELDVDGPLQVSQ